MVRTTLARPSATMTDFKFPGRGQRKTPVTDVRGAVELAFLLPGRHAALIRRQAADLLVRLLGGDLGIIAEVCALRGFPGEFAARAPEDPRRVFGEAVEAAGVTNAAGACEQVLGRLLPSLIEKFCVALVAKVAVQIDERFAEIAKQEGPRGQKRKERPQPVASNAKRLRFEGEDHLPSAYSKYMKRLESANTTVTRADLAERHVANAMAAAQVQSPGSQLKGEDKVVQRMIHKCWGQELSSKSVHQKVRNLRCTIDSGISARGIPQMEVSWARLFMRVDVLNILGKVNHAQHQPQTSAKPNPKSNPNRLQIGPTSTPK